jgi:hypothetical protein
MSSLGELFDWEHAAAKRPARPATNAMRGARSRSRKVFLMLVSPEAEILAVVPA